MDHAHPTDLAFIIPSEMEFSGVIRKSDNILEIFESINLIVNLFTKNLTKLIISDIEAAVRRKTLRYMIT